jgi:hypothetical protein
MGSKMQPQKMRQQKSDQILILKFGFIHVHRKFNCGFATHFLCYTLTIVMNNVLLDFSQKFFFDC